MGKQVKKSKAEIATIDCSLITIETAAGEFGFDTSNKLGVEPQIEEEEAVKLVLKGILRAQKPGVSTITGHELKLTDNVFNPELALAVQGGRIIYDTENPTEIVGYEPPVAGSGEKGEVFKLNAYTAQYDASGRIVKYEKITYPNCQGVPIAFGSEDGAFRAPEYTIRSAPSKGEAPYRITYVNALPVMVNEFTLGTLTVTSVAGTGSGKTKITVSPAKEEYTNKYAYKTDLADITLPTYGELVPAYTQWDGKVELTVATGQHIAVVECDAAGKVLAGGKTTVKSAV